MIVSQQSESGWRSGRWAGLDPLRAYACAAPVAREASMAVSSMIAKHDRISAARVLRLRRDGLDTGPPPTMQDAAPAGHLDAVIATFESSKLPNPPRTAVTVASGRKAATTTTNAKATLRGDQRQGLSSDGSSGRAGRGHDRADATERSGARPIAKAVPTLRLELIAASIRAEAAAKPTGDTNE